MSLTWKIFLLTPALLVAYITLTCVNTYIHQSWAIKTVAKLSLDKKSIFWAFISLVSIKAHRGSNTSEPLDLLSVVFVSLRGRVLMWLLPGRLCLFHFSNNFLHSSSVARSRDNQQRFDAWNRNRFVSFKHPFPEPKSVDIASKKQRTWTNWSRHRQRPFAESKSRHDSWPRRLVPWWVADCRGHSRLSVAQLRRARIHRQRLQTNSCPSSIDPVWTSPPYK